MTEQTTTKRPRKMAREPKPEAQVETLPVIEPNARRTKASQVLELLRRPEGATLAELVETTGWLPHTTRAALTGLRKKGYTIDRSKREDVTCYRIAEVA